MIFSHSKKSRKMLFLEEFLVIPRIFLMKYCIKWSNTCK